MEINILTVGEFGSIAIGWIVWNRSTLDPHIKSYSSKIQNSLDRDEFIKLLAAGRVAAKVYKNSHDRFEEAAILKRQDCMPPLQVGVSGPPIYTMRQNDGVEIDVYNLDQATIVNHIGHDFIMCTSQYLNSQLSNINQIVDVNFLSMDNRILIHFKHKEV